MPFTLDLAITYACALVLVYWIAAFLAPLLAHALGTAIARAFSRLRARLSGGKRDAWVPHHFPDVRVKPLF